MDVTSMRLHWCNHGNWTGAGFGATQITRRVTREARRHDRPHRVAGWCDGWSEHCESARCAHLWRGAAAALFALCAAGCSETTSSNASLTTAAPVRPDHRVRFDRRPAGRRVQPAGGQPLGRGAGAPAGARVARGRRELPRARLSRRAGDPRPHAYLLGMGRLRRRQAARAAHRRRGSGRTRRRRPLERRRRGDAAPDRPRQHGAAREFRGESRRAGCRSGDCGRGRAGTGTPAAAPALRRRPAERGRAARAFGCPDNYFRTAQSS